MRSIFMASISKRVRTRQGVQYFDQGGNVLQPQQTVLPNGGAADGTQAPGVVGQFENSPTLNPGPGIVHTAVTGVNQAAQPLINSVTGTIAPIGQAAQDIGAAFTAQNPYTAGLAPTSLTDYGGVIAPAATQAVAGAGQFGQNAEQQQQLINALRMQAVGQGPNPAQAALAENTAANVANQAALAAGVRGASANAGAIAREAAIRGGAIQQNAVGQAATLEAQQRLAVQKEALAGEQGLGTQIIGEQNANTNLFTGAAGAQNTQNTGQISNYNDAQTLNQKTSSDNAAATNKTTGGLLNGAGSLLSFLAKGGVVPGHPLHKMASLYHPHVMKEGGTVPGKPKVNRNSYKNDDVPAMLSPEEIVLPLSVTQAPDAPERAREFVANALKGKMGTSNKEDETDFKSALKKAISSRKESRA